MQQSIGFSVIDYCVLGVTVFGSLFIGLYHAFRGNNTAEDYAMAGRSMKPLPVSLSLLATFLSADVLLGFSGEVYGHGLGLAWIVIGTSLAIAFAATVVLPVLYPLRLVSPNQYLEIRFNSPWLRRVTMVMTFISITLFMGLALYAPTLALSAVTPLSHSTYIWIMGLVVTVYASFGGLKGVVWTDVFQMVLMVGGVLLVTVMAAVEVGGLGRAWEIAKEGGRTAGTNTAMDLNTRHTVWNVISLTFVNWGSHYSVSHANYQRISSVPTMVEAKRVLYYNIVGMSLFLVTVFLMGICIFAVYAGCDPYAQGFIFSKDQITPYYVNDRLSHLPGVPGIFVATLLSAALSSLSSGVNTLATLLWADIVSQMPCFRQATDFTAATVSKVITACLGLLIIGLAFLASKLGGLVQASYTIVGVMSGPVLGAHLLGMAVPFSNWRGAFLGILTGWGLCVWIGIGGLRYKPQPDLLPFSTVNCSLTDVVMMTSAINTTASSGAVSAVTDSCIPESDLSCESASFGLQSLYTISYAHYPFIGLFTCLTIGILVSLATGYRDPNEVPAELLLVPMRRFFGKKARDSRSDSSSNDVVSSMKYMKAETDENFL